MLLALLLLAFFVWCEDDVVEEIPSKVVTLSLDNFDEAVLQPTSGLWFVKFYAPWCGHCKKLAPIWRDFALKEADNADESDAIHVAEVDCDAFKSVCRAHNVGGFPTLQLFQNGVRIAEFHGSRTPEAFHEFALDSISVVSFGKEKLRALPVLSAMDYVSKVHYFNKWVILCETNPHSDAILGLINEEYLGGKTHFAAISVDSDEFETLSEGLRLKCASEDPIERSQAVIVFRGGVYAFEGQMPFSALQDWIESITADSPAQFETPDLSRLEYKRREQFMMKIMYGAIVGILVLSVICCVMVYCVIQEDRQRAAAEKALEDAPGLRPSVPTSSGEDVLLPVADDRKKHD